MYSVVEQTNKNSGRNIKSPYLKSNHYSYSENIKYSNEKIKQFPKLKFDN